MGVYVIIFYKVNVLIWQIKYCLFNSTDNITLKDFLSVTALRDGT